MKPFCVLVLFLSTMTALAKAGKDAEVINYSTRVELKGTVLSYQVYVSIQVNSREGEDYTYVSIPFNKGNSIKGLDAWISSADSNVIRRLKKSEIKTVSAVSEGALYEDEFVKAFQLKHNTYPYQLHYTYSISFFQFINIADWYPTIGTLPCRSARLVFEVDEVNEFSIFQRGVEQPGFDQVGEIKKYTWEVSDIAVQKSEDYSPPDELLPTVKITPKSFRYGLKGKLTSWEEFGNWQYNTNKGLRELPESEKKNIDLLLRGITDPGEKVKKLYQYLQDHTRYILVVEGIGGLKPYPASYVSSNKYGDCKALTNFMMAMLDYIGISSYYTKVNAGEEITPLIRELPGQQFNHVFVTVPIKEDTLWLECTSKYTPFNYMGTFTQNREALLVTENDSRLIRTPALAPQQVTELRKIRSTINGNGVAEVDLTYEFKGDVFELLLQLLHDYTKQEQEKYIRRIIPFADFELKEWNLRQAHRDDDFVTLEVRLTTRSFAKKYGNQLVIKPLSFGIPVLETPSKRQQPFVLHYPIHQVDSLEITIADNLQIINIPENTKAEHGGSYYETQSSEEGNLIKISRTWTLQSGTYAGDDYVQVQSFLQAIRGSESNSALVLAPR